MANPNLVHEGNFLIEMSGVGTLRAQEFEAPESKHMPFKVDVGDDLLPVWGDGKYEITEGTIKAAIGLGTAASDMNNLYQQHKQRLDLGRFFIRVISLASDGRTQVGTDEWTECIITSMKPSSKKASGKDAAMFDFKFQPTNHFSVY